MWHNKANRMEIFSDPSFLSTILTTKCTKSDAPAGRCAPARHSNLAQSCTTRHGHMTKYTTQNLPPPPQFFKHQLQVCVYENKGRILMNFATKPPFRILARSPHLVFWIVKNVFYWWSNNSRHTETAMDSIYWNEEYLEPRIEGYLLIVLNLPRCSWCD